jgi:hypothetical protein
MKMNSGAPGVPARQNPSTAISQDGQDARRSTHDSSHQAALVTRLVTRNNRRLDIPAAVQHVTQHVL